MEISTSVIIVIIILLILVFNGPICYWIDHTKKSITDAFNKKESGKSKYFMPDDDQIEHLDNPVNGNVLLPPGQTSDTLYALGYTGTLPWTEVLQATEIDPATHVSHMDFVKDVRRFSSGANFTSVTDDNTSIDFVGFRGLQRPQHVDIGRDARQQPDIDEDVLKRNKQLRW
jgi:hypothetical protein